MNIKKAIITGIIIFLSLSCSQRNAEYYFVKGYESYEKKKYESAIEYFTKAIDVSNQYADAYLGRAMAYDKLGKTELAIVDYTSLIKYAKTERRRAIAYTNRGINYSSLSEYDKAISDFETATELDSVFLKPYFKLAEIYEEQNDLDLSTEYLSKIISIDSLNAEAYFLRGANFANQNRFNEAVEDLNVAIRLEPNNDKFYLLRASSYTLSYNIELALQDFNKGIEINPTDNKLFFMRGGLYEKFLNNREKAIEDFKKSADLGNNDALSVLQDFYKIDYPQGK